MSEKIPLMQWFSFVVASKFRLGGEASELERSGYVSNLRHVGMGCYAFDVTDAGRAALREWSEQCRAVAKRPRLPSDN